MDYLKHPLRERAKLRASDPVNFAQYPAAVGGIWTREGKGSRFVKECGLDRAAWIEPGELSLRFIGSSSAILGRIGRRLGHTGWFVNHHQDETTQGVVYRLSHCRFVAGAADPWQADRHGNGPAVIIPAVWYNAEDAAYAAEEIAERYAEFLREDYAKQAAEYQIEEKRQEIADLRKETRALIEGLRLSSVHPTVCARLKADLKSLRRDSAACWKQIARLEANFWSAVTP